MSRHKFLIELEVVDEYMADPVVENTQAILETLPERLEGCPIKETKKGLLVSTGNYIKTVKVVSLHEFD